MYIHDPFGLIHVADSAGKCTLDKKKTLKPWIYASFPTFFFGFTNFESLEATAGYTWIFEDEPHVPTSSLSAFLCHIFDTRLTLQQVSIVLFLIHRIM